MLENSNSVDFCNGCRIYVDDMLLIFVAISPRIYWSGSLSSRRKDDGVTGGGEIVLLAGYIVHFLRVHENLV